MVSSTIFLDLDIADVEVRLKSAISIAELGLQPSNLSSVQPYPAVAVSMLRDSSKLVASIRLSVISLLRKDGGSIYQGHTEVDALTLKVLLALLETPYPPFREVVVQALGAVGTASVFDQISTLVKDEDDHVRDAAVEALIQMNPDRALSFLISQLTEPSPLIRLLLLRKLYLYTFDEETQAYEQTRFISTDLAPFRDKIAALTKDADVAVRESAMRLLHEMDNTIRA